MFILFIFKLVTFSGFNVGLKTEKFIASDTVFKLDSTKTPLYIIDGKEVANINDLNLNRIVSVNVFKGKVAESKYGLKGKNGVVIIKTNYYYQGTGNFNLENLINDTKDSNSYDFPEPIFTYTEEQPSFKGGSVALYKYISKAIKYPNVAMKFNIQGKVILKFIIEKDGQISNIEVLKGVGHGCDEEAVRILKESSKWNPGKQNGYPKRVYFTMPIIFKISK